MSMVRNKVIRREKGEIMLEAILVMIPTLFVMIFLLSLGFLLYQKWNVQFLADEVASKVAVRYEYIEEEMPGEKISLNDAQKTVLYKYLFQGDNIENKNQEKSLKYGTALSKKTSFGVGSGNETVEMECVEDSMARRHISVNVTGTYRIPFSEGLEILGMEGTRTFTATSYAECVDITDYMNTVVFSRQVGEILFSSGNIYKMINSWMGVFSKVFK